MKIRCIENSIRLRLTKSDIRELMQEGTVRIQLNISSVAQLNFVLVNQVGAATPGVSMHQSTLRMVLPAEDCKEWATTDRVGIEYLLPTGGEHPLHLLIEKDFPCQTREDEDKEDTFYELADKSC